MKVKLDENLPQRVVELFTTLSDDVETVAGEGLAGNDDETVSQAAADEDRLIVTLDRGFGDVRHYPPGSHPGILVVRVDDQAATAVATAVELVIRTVDLETLAGCVAVFRDGRLRVRRPPDPTS